MAGNRIVSGQTKDNSGSGLANWQLFLALGLAASAAVGGYRQIERVRRSTKLSGKTAVVTGGSRGLGLIIARKLALAGARVCIVARNGDELARAREQILSRAGAADVFTVIADVADRDEIRAAMQSAQSLFDAPIDILVNNAGIIQVGPSETMVESDYDEAMKTHFWGPYYAIQQVLPQMRERRSGRIVNVASIGGKISVPHLLPYSTSKFALVGFSEGLRSELLKDNVFVTTVCPGLIRTGSPRNAQFKGNHAAEYAWFALSDSLPVLSMSADRCADQIIRALRFGDAELVTSAVGKLGALVHGVAPSFVIDALGFVNGLLPAGASGTDRIKGSESETAVTQSFLTALTRKAEAANNQL